MKEEIAKLIAEWEMRLTMITPPSKENGYAMRYRVKQQLGQKFIEDLKKIIE